MKHALQDIRHYVGPGGKRVSDMSLEECQKELCIVYDLIQNICEGSSFKDVGAAIDVASNYMGNI